VAVIRIALVGLWCGIGFVVMLWFSEFVVIVWFAGFSLFVCYFV